ncbi:MAG: Ig-like domain-containing protein [Deltaproteobacteria bacterium]|nr:Ig-like domain-containing protein [Deltaproteobacteria bacterium]
MLATTTTRTAALALLLTLGACTCGDGAGSKDGAAAATDGDELPPAEPPPMSIDGAGPAPALVDPGGDERTGGEERGHWPRVVSSCETAGCVVEIAFPVAMVREPKTAPAPAVVITPADQRGTLAWTSARTLAFTPGPGSLHWGHELTLSFSGLTPQEPLGDGDVLDEPALVSVSAPRFAAAGKVASWPVVIGQPRAVALLNDYSQQVGTGALYALYDQPVDAAEIGKGSKASVGDRALTVRAARPASVEQVTAQPVDLHHVVALSVDLQTLESGASLTLSLPTHDERGDQTDSTWPLTVQKEAQLTDLLLPNVEDQQRVPLSTHLSLSFTSPVSPGLLQKNLVIEPAAQIGQVSAWSQASVQLQLQPGTRYTVKLGPGMTDILGNPIAPKEALSFTTQDLPPQLALAQASVVVERGRAVLPVLARNVGALAPTVVRLEGAEQWIGAQQSKCAKVDAQGGVAAPPIPTPSTMNAPTTLELDLGAAAGERARGGLFCVRVEAPGRGSEAKGALTSTMPLQITDLGVTTKLHERGALVWVTRLSSAAPVAGAKLEVFDAKGERMGTGVTDAEGTALIDLGGIAAQAGREQPIYVAARTDDDLAVAEVGPGRLAEPWQFGLPGTTSAPLPLPAALFSERGAYRPGEQVQLKVIVGVDDLLPAVPAGQRMKLVVTDPRGQAALDKQLTLDELGTAHHQLALKEGAEVGEWSARVTLGARSASTTFRVEEFRVPTFQVKLAIPDAGNVWAPGKTASARVSASYLHGGGLSGRPVKVRVTRAPEPFAPPQFPGFSFAAGASAPSAEVMSTEARLDGQGLYGFELPLSHDASVGAVRYAFEAVVQDVDRQAYAGRASRVVFPARFALGTKAPPRAVLGAGETVEVPLVAVATGGDDAGVVLPGVRVRARLERLDAHTTARSTRTEGRGQSVQLEGHDVVVTGEVCNVTTGKGVARCSFTVPEPGRYRVRAWARDRDGNDVQTGFAFTASGTGVAAWPRFDQERVELVADKAVYAPGETARLVVSSPFAKASALLTIERAGVLERRVVTIDGTTPAIEVPLRGDYAPNVFASVVLLRGRTHDQKDASGFQTGAPAMRLGSTMLRVEPRERRVQVAVSTDRAIANPGATVTVHIAAKDHTGNGTSLANAQATLMVVDEAVLGLTGYATPDPMKQLYRERPLGVRTGESRLETLFAMRQRRDTLFPGGDGGDGLSLSDFPDDVRSLFKSTAYYQPNVRLGADGSADVSFPLPDNVTTFRVMAVVIAAGARTGAGDVKLVSKKPLLVQAIAPRFVHPGDRLRVEALVFNSSGGPGEVEVGARFEGMKITSVGAAKSAVDVEHGKQGKVGWDVEVTGRDTATVRLVAKLGKLEDAVELKLPIRNPGTKRTLVAKSTFTGKGGARIDVPADRVPGTAKVEVLASATMLTELRDAVGYLMGYPNGCIEQTTSTAYPLVVLEELLPDIGVEVNKDELKKYREAGIKRILSFQTTKGGLAYWPGSDEPHAFATAFGLTALIEAKQRGHYDVPDEALRRMGDYLEKTLQKGSVTEAIPHGGIADGDTRALFVMTLGRLKRPQHAWVETLWRERDKLTPFGLSFLATAVEEGSGNRALKEPILALIAERAKKESAEAWYEGAARGGYSMDSPLRTHAGAVLAFATGGSSQPVAGQLVNGLLKRQMGGMWGNTQENVFGIMGVAAMARSTEGAGQAPALVLAVNGKVVADNKLEAAGSRTQRLRLDEDEAGLTGAKAATVSINAESGKPLPVNLRVRVEYDAALTPQNKQARAHGFTISRSVETLEGAPLATVLPLGQVVRVRLKVKGERQANYVAIDDKLPAGLEPMNLALETTEKLSLGAMTPERQRATERLSFSEIRDHRVAFFIDDMPAGSYELVYLARATTAGHFLRPAASVEAMYDPELNGATVIDEVDVR